MNEKEKFVKELADKLRDEMVWTGQYDSAEPDYEYLAKWVIADRKRVVEPIDMIYKVIKTHEKENVEAGIFWKESKKKWPLIIAIEEGMKQTLKLSGVEL